MRYLSLFPVVVVAAVWVFLAPLTRDGDLWLHLAAGRSIADWLTGGKPFPWADPFGYLPSNGNELHSWLGQWALWTIYKTTGEIGLRLFHLLCLYTCFFLMGRWVWRRCGKQMFVVSIVVTLGFLLHRELADFEPWLFGELFFCLFVFGLDSDPHRATARRAAMVFGLCVLWINLHGSGLMALPLLFAYAFFERSHRDRQAYRYPLAAFAALLVTPQGGAIFHNALMLSRASQGLGVAEWSAQLPFLFRDKSLVIVLTFVTFLYVWLAACLGLVWKCRRQFKFTSTDRFVAGQSVLFCLMSILSLRHSIFLLYPLAAFTTYAWNGARKKWEFPYLRRRVQLIASFAVCVVILFWSKGARTEMGAGIPTRAADFMKQTRLRGNVFNDQTWGGYLSFIAYPHLKIAVDGRILVSKHLLTRMKESERAEGRVNVVQILNEMPQTDLIVHRSRVPFRELLGKDWIVVFENNAATILLRKNEANRENFGRVQNYYRDKAIPFSNERGFDLRAAYGASRTWVNEMEEHFDDGGWPLDGISDYRIMADANFYLTRRLGVIGVDRLKTALLEDVTNAKLGVLLGEILVASGRSKEARKWLIEMEGLDIPAPQLAPVRLALKSVEP